MTTAEIRSLVRELFRQGPMGPVYRAVGRRISLDELERRALDDPAFAGELAAWFAEARERLPGYITAPALLRFNRYLLEPNSPQADLTMALAHGLSLPGSQSATELLQAVLVCDGITTVAAAELLGQDPKVVELYETLFFNVFDRKRDRIYLSQICGKTSREGAPVPGRALASNPDLLLVAFDSGSAEAVSQASRTLRLNRHEANQLIEAGQKSLLASAGAKLALGQTSPKTNPTLKAALRLLSGKAKLQPHEPEPGLDVAEAAQLVLDQILANRSTDQQSGSSRENTRGPDSMPPAANSS